MAVHLVIIGNGFDLNLGLPTGYSDFIKSEQFKKLIEENNNLATYLEKQHQLQNWVDIELELKKYARIQDIKKIEEFKENFRTLCVALSDYLNTLRDKDINRKSHAFHMLTKAIALRNSMIIDFNYTNSVKDIIIKDCLSNPTGMLQKIHGSLDNKDIIFGVEDGIRNINPDYLFLQKSYHKSFGSVKMSELLKTSSEISFFGHSLGVTDEKYLIDYFHSAASSSFNLNLHNKKINFYHYGQKSFDELLKRIDILTSMKIGQFKINNDIRFIDVSLPL